MIVVVGDALLDADLTGRARRLMPEAPVPVLDQLQEVRRPGGAGLAAALAARDGAEVVLIAPIAGDEAGAQLRAEIDAAGVTLVAVRTGRGTAVKRRVRSGGQSLLRLDSGDSPLGPGGAELGELPEAAVAALRRAEAVLVSDYGRGMSGHAELRAVLGDLPRRTPVVWDPHPRGAAPTAGARLVTPNEAEAGAAGPGLAALADRAAELVAAWGSEAVAVTLGARGALLSRGESSPSILPAPRVAARDTCGAGDRFAVSAALALARGALTPEAVQEAVDAAAAFVAEGGAAALGRADGADRTDGVEGAEGTGTGLDAVARVRARGGTVVATGGCFDLLHAGHVATLEAARALGDCLVVCLNSDDSVRRLKGPSRPLVPAADRARVLEALAPVDAVVVFEEDTPLEAIRRLRPDVWAKGGDYAGTELPEAALLREWGGQSVVLPYLRGRSTTRIVETARAR